METNTNSSSKWIFVIIISVVLVVAVMVSINMAGKKKGVTLPTGQKQDMTAKKTPSTALYFSPNEQTVTKGQTIKVVAYMNTSIESVNGVDLKTIYDPNVFEVIKFTKSTNLGGFAQEIKNEIDNTAGVFKYSAFSFEPSTFLKGANVSLYTLDVKVKTNAPAGMYTFDFDPATAISASKAGQNMFSGSTPQKITVR